jgi:hypothetical protein
MRPAEEPKTACEPRHATGWQGRGRRDRQHRQRRLGWTRQAPPKSASAERLRETGQTREVSPVSKNQEYPVEALRPQTESEFHQKRHAAR